MCDPQRRSRSVEAFGQFGGVPCKEPIGDREFCTTSDSCVDPPPPECSESQFQCDSGTSALFKSPTVSYPCCFWPSQFNKHLCAGSCISKRFECNGDFDCEDGSDEPLDCEPTQKPCRNRDLIANEQARTAGYGYKRIFKELITLVSRGQWYKMEALLLQSKALKWCWHVGPVTVTRCSNVREQSRKRLLSLILSEFSCFN